MLEQATLVFSPEYAIEQVIDDSAPRRLYRARRLRDGQRLLLKLVQRQAQREAQRLRREFALSRQCELEGVLRALDWSEDDQFCALILEDPGGEPLDRLLDDGPLALLFEPL